MVNEAVKIVKQDNHSKMKRKDKKFTEQIRKKKN